MFINFGENKKNMKKLRDEFAMAALPEVMKLMNKYGEKNKIVVEEIQVAKTAYSYADAMLEARK